MGVELLDVDGVQVAVRRSPRARRVRLVAKAGRGVELVLPARGGEDTGRQLIHTHRDWIVAQSARLEERRLGLERSGVVWRHGTALPLTLRHAERARVMSTDDSVTVAAPDAASAERVLETIEAEAVIFGQRLSSPEATEAFSAFFQKRKPDFSSFS